MIKHGRWSVANAHYFCIEVMIEVMIVDDKNCDERLVAVEQRAVSNTRRIDKLEQDNGALHEMATSIKVMATEMEYMRKAQDDLNDRITVIEDKPAARMEQIVSAVIVALVGICIGYLFGGGF